MFSLAKGSAVDDSIKSPSIPFLISPSTKYILSTSGRISSLKRYQQLLQKILKLDIAYLPIHSGDTSSKVDPKRYVAALRGLPCIGGSISKDIKQSVVPFLDELDHSAADVQTVNTIIVRSDLTLIGYNTDVLGFKIAIERGISSSGANIKSAVCYGYGGVAAVVVSVLKSLGIIVFISGRNLQAAKDKADELGVDVWSVNIEADLFVNATPASEHPLDLAPNLITALSKATIAFDHEMPGKYLREYCETHSIYHINGTEMYYPQMKVQWSLFLKGIVDEKDIDQLLRQAESSDAT